MKNPKITSVEVLKHEPSECIPRNAGIDLYIRINGQPEEATLVRLDGRWQMYKDHMRSMTHNNADVIYGVPHHGTGPYYHGKVYEIISECLERYANANVPWVGDEPSALPAKSVITASFSDALLGTQEVQSLGKVTLETDD